MYDYKLALVLQNNLITSRNVSVNINIHSKTVTIFFQVPVLGTIANSVYNCAILLKLGLTWPFYFQL